ncbi:MAG: class I SAM-dependent methyltransferase, partial [Thermoproteota archaeon]|nr:class I SAM-dependent methyltransferase [Thermoproteota archaeon]
MDSNNNNSIFESSKTWALGSYNEIAIFLLPVSAHLVRICQVSQYDNVLDVACGTGNTAITARRLGGAKVTGIDITPELLSQAKAEASLTGINDIQWNEGDVEHLPYQDETFDVVLSSFGHIFAPHPQTAMHEMLRVTKKGGRIAFSTWPPEHANGRVFRVMEKHLSQPGLEPNPYHSPETFLLNPDPADPSSSNTIPPSPIQWGIPSTIEKRLGNQVKDIYFERGVILKPMLSPNHYWDISSKKA